MCIRDRHVFVEELKVLHMRHDSGADVKVRPQSSNVIKVRMRTDQPTNRLVRSQLHDFFNNRQAPFFVPGRFKHRNEIIELHHIAIGGATAKEVDPLRHLLNHNLGRPGRLCHRRWDRDRVVAHVRLHIRKLSAVGVVAGACAVELPVVVPSLVRVPGNWPFHVAEDAAELVVAEFRELEVVLDPASEPVDFLNGHTTEAALLEQGYGEIEAAFAAAHEIIELDLSIGRHSGVPMETRGAIGRYDAARDVLELHGAAKVPHRNREALARLFGRDPSGVHVYESHVGGGFGIRGEICLLYTSPSPRDGLLSRMRSSA